MAADWEEIKRLAADFQKAQLSSTLQRLSERNCIEIVQWLIQQRLLDVIFSSDGKEYITPEHLIQEIRSELYVQGGRANLVELAKNIGVDLSHINNSIPEVIKGNRGIQLVLGQLIDEQYVTRLAGEINEKLQQQGQLSVNDLTINYDLPAEFLQKNVIERHLGNLINGKQDSTDPKVFFTEAFVARSRAKIRGALAGITRPTPVTAIVNQTGVQDRLFFSLFDTVGSVSGHLTGRMTGAQYIPHIHTRTQNEWANNFYRQNGYLEYDALSRLGISDPKGFARKLTGNDASAVPLPSCIVSGRIIDQVDADIEECIASASFVDLRGCLPSVFSDGDISTIIDSVITDVRKRSVFIMDTFVLSKKFVNELEASCEILAKEAAKRAVDDGSYQKHVTDTLSRVDHQEIAITQESRVTDAKADRREERRRRAAGGKAGGGAQGRETKTKSTTSKKGSRKQKQEDSDEEDAGIDRKRKQGREPLRLVTEVDVTKAMASRLEQEGLEELADALAESLVPRLNALALESAAELFASAASSNASQRRKAHAILQERLNTRLNDLRLFEKGLKLFPAEAQAQLVRYLLKTVGSDAASDIIGYLGSESAAAGDVEMTPEHRQRLVAELPAEQKADAHALLKTLSGASVEDFTAAAERCISSCGIVLKKTDKKKDRAVALSHRHELAERLTACEDPALALHLAAVLLFETATQSMLHASGRHVASVLTLLAQQGFLSEDHVGRLRVFHDQVTAYLATDDVDMKAALAAQLKQDIPAVRSIALEFKKQTSTNQ